MRQDYPQKLNKISESTLVPISLIFTIVGGIGYVTFVAFQGSANATAIERIEQKQEDINKIKTDIEIIKIKLENIDNALKGGR